jgi:hypothetical protein
VTETLRQEQIDEPGVTGRPSADPALAAVAVVRIHRDRTTAAPSSLTKGTIMNISRDQILDLLHGQGDHDKADQAAQQLPDQANIDNSEHAGMLSKVGLEADMLKGKLGGLGGLLKWSDWSSA